MLTNLEIRSITQGLGSLNHCFVFSFEDYPVSNAIILYNCFKGFHWQKCLLYLYAADEWAQKLDIVTSVLESSEVSNVVDNVRRCHKSVT